MLYNNSADVEYFSTSLKTTNSSTFIFDATTKIVSDSDIIISTGLQWVY